jgi:N utilization substance protein A
VARTPKGPRVIVSRSHPDLLRRLFEMEVPEVYNGTVEIKAVAREAGFRSKIAVAAKQDGIDPVGCCVGLRGIRIQNIVSELNGEKIDVVMWNPDTAALIANALSPASIVNVELNEDEEAATVIVPDKQLSLAIGKEGQNARLAAKLTGWRIDIKSASAAEAEKLEKAAEAPEAVEAGEAAEAAAEAPAGETPEEVLAALEPLEPVEETAEATTEEAVGEEAKAEEAEEILVPPEVVFEPPAAEEKPLLRFAEDILTPRPAKTPAKTSKTKKKKKGAYAKESAEDGIRLRKGRRDINIEEDEDYY